MTGNATVLLVDDERHVTESLAVALRSEPYSIITASSAAEALRIVANRPVDVVVADEMMPGMRGTEMLGVIARDHERIARIVLTGRPSLEAAERAINEGKVTAFLRKPCPTDALKRAIADALGVQEAKRAPTGGADLSVFDPALLGTLSNREREVLERIAFGERVSRVAKALFISEHTVRNHLKSIFAKLDVHSQAELVSIARSRPAPR